MRLVLALHIACTLSGQPPLGDLLQKWQSGVRPGVALAIVQDGRIQHMQTRGYANLGRKVPVETNTRFLIGSISKQFTATAILLLAQDGKLRLEDTAARFVPELPRFGHSITIRQLLHHTAGLPDHEELLAGRIGPEFFLNAAQSRSAPWTAAQAMRALQQSSGLRFPPGTKWEYSNTGYMVLGQVIERVCRCTYADFLRRRIFDRLQMKDSLVIPYPPAQVGKLSEAYLLQKGQWKNISYSPLNFIPGHDGVISTIADMALWAASVGSEKLLVPDANTSIWASGRTADNKATQYGYGWRISDLNGVKVFEHEGCWSGFRNGIVRSADGSTVAVVLTNATDAAEFWNCREGLDLARQALARHSSR